MLMALSVRVVVTRTDDPTPTAFVLRNRRMYASGAVAVVNWLEAGRFLLWLVWDLG